MEIMTLQKGEDWVKVLDVSKDLLLEKDEWGNERTLV